MEIKNIEELVQKLQKLYKYDVWMHITFHKPSEITTIIEQDLKYETVTYSLVNMTQISNFTIYRKGNANAFIYYDRWNLYYDNQKRKKIIFNYPTYDEVYDFLYKYYICPLTLKKEQYLSLNKIFKRKKVRC